MTTEQKDSSGRSAARHLDNFLQICKIQASLNDVMAGKEWITQAGNGQKIDYAECIRAELFELHKSAVPYKFWGAGEVLDLENARMEVVDILHFAISYDLALAYRMFNGTHDERMVRAITEVANRMAKQPPAPVSVTTRYALNDFNLTLCLSSRSNSYINWTEFWCLASSCNLTMDTIVNIYLAKVELNKFRTERYKSGVPYSKVWGDGREDNAHLMVWVENQGDSFSAAKVQEWLKAEELVQSTAATLKSGV